MSESATQERAQPARLQPFTLTQVTLAIGAEVAGIDLRQPLLMSAPAHRG